MKTGLRQRAQIKSSTPPPAEKNLNAAGMTLTRSSPLPHFRDSR
jgi:hypothetical protein